MGASGATKPCTDITGPNTLLLGNGNGYGEMQVGRDGYLHTTAFQSNGPGGLLIFKPNANGNAAPWRAVSVDQDHVALATDPKRTDYVVASQGYAFDNCWYVVPHGATMPSLSNCDTQVQAIYALAADKRGELYAIGFDVANNELRVDVFRHPSSPSPTLVRTIEGSSTGFPTNSGSYFNCTFALATDPLKATLYTYFGGPVCPPTVEEFGAQSSGNVKPARTITGSLTELPAMAFAANVMTVAQNGDLYVSTQTPSILVFGPHGHGNVKPNRVITDPSAPSQSTAVGIAVRPTTVSP